MAKVSESGLDRIIILKFLHPTCYQICRQRLTPLRIQPSLASLKPAPPQQRPFCVVTETEDQDGPQAHQQSWCVHHLRRLPKSCALLFQSPHLMAQGSKCGHTRVHAARWAANVTQPSALEGEGLLATERLRPCDVCMCADKCSSALSGEVHALHDDMDTKIGIRRARGQARTSQRHV